MSSRGVCLTGDVHHSSLLNEDRRYVKATEIISALSAANIAAEYGLKITLFFTGLCSKESPDVLHEISKMNHVEIGGHNYYCFKPRKLFNVYYRLTGLKNGPFFYQDWEVRRTIRTLEQVVEYRIVSWRDHCYRHDRNTPTILLKNGIRFWSDRLSKNDEQPSSESGLVVVPINTLPDHDYVYHGRRQPGTVDEDHLRRTVFATAPMTKEQWLDRIKRDVEHICGKKGLATLLAHPACMEVLDDFKTFRLLCEFLAGYPSWKMREVSP